VTGEGGASRLSVIIPAHNEAGTIAACLESVLASGIAEDLDVIVAGNGCTDATTAIARGVSDRIRVLESAIAAKHAALNAGDDIALAPSRAYLDADTIVSDGALEAVALLLEQHGVLAVSPEVRFDDTRCSWPARQFHRIWRQSPYFATTTLGAGFYALSAEGRRRFDRFPPVVGDDYFVAGLFAAHERRTAVGHTYTPLLPTTLRSMLHVHIRHYGAHVQFEEWWSGHGNGPLPGHAPDGYGWLRGAMRSPANWPGVVLYAAVKALSILLGRRKHARQGMKRWNRDEGGGRAAQA